jgi:hypothetical protein
MTREVRIFLTPGLELGLAAEPKRVFHLGTPGIGHSTMQAHAVGASGEREFSAGFAPRVGVRPRGGCGRHGLYLCPYKHVRWILVEFLRGFQMASA